MIRTASGAVLLILLLGAVFASPYTMALLFVLLSIGVMLEFYHMARLSGADPLRVYPIVIGASLVGTTFGVASGFLEWMWLLIFLPLLFALFVIELYRKSAVPGSNIAWAVMGLLYGAVPFALLVALPCSPAEGGGFLYRPLLVLSVIFIVWANDVGAYLVGMTFGRTKLFERLSPKKSWEGFFGGIVCATLVGLLMGYWQQGALGWWAGAGLVIAVSAVFGDLVESMFKRSVDLKDSGSAIPGHGGFLDRFDALLLAVPCAFVYLTLFAL